MKNFPRFFAAALAFAALWSGCNTEPHPGIEIGNPDLDQAKVRIVPDEGSEFYQIQRIDASTALAEQFQKTESGPILLDTVGVTYTQAGETVSFQASFSNDRSIDVSAGLAQGGQVQSVFLKVDGLPVPSCFDDPDLAPACDTSSAPAVALPEPAPQDDPAQEPETLPAPAVTENSEDDGSSTLYQLRDCRIPTVDDAGNANFQPCPPPPQPPWMTLRAPLPFADAP